MDVRYRHYRNLPRDEMGRLIDECRELGILRQYGGRPERQSVYDAQAVTLCTIGTGQGVYFGVAVCSNVDQFSRRRGRLIARRRAEHARRRRVRLASCAC